MIVYEGSDLPSAGTFISGLRSSYITVTSGTNKTPNKDCLGVWTYGLGLRLYGNTVVHVVQVPEGCVTELDARKLHMPGTLTPRLPSSCASGKPRFHMKAMDHS